MLDDLTIYILLFVFGLLAFTISTLSGGGGALLLLPAVSYLIGISSTAPVVNLGNFIGRPARLFLFWKYINWKVVKFYVPPALLGGFLGAWLFSAINLKILQLLLGTFLISTIFQFRFGREKRSFQMKYVWFAPLGFLIAFISTLVGATGAVLNPFYLNIGLEKEQLIATKTANSFLVGVVQLSSYAFFGALDGKLWYYGVALGLGMATGNYLGKHYLKKISAESFRKLVIYMMVLSGVVMILKILTG